MICHVLGIRVLESVLFYKFMLTSCKIQKNEEYYDVKSCLTRVPRSGRRSQKPEDFDVLNCVWHHTVPVFYKTDMPQLSINKRSTQNKHQENQFVSFGYLISYSNSHSLLIKALHSNTQNVIDFDQKPSSVKILPALIPADNNLDLRRPTAAIDFVVTASESASSSSQSRRQYP